MKRIISCACALLLVAASVLFGGCGAPVNTDVTVESTYTKEFAGKSLNVYNWAEYISVGEDDTLNVNAAFEKLTGIRVNYNTYESNEVLYSTLTGGTVQCEIIIPSDYMIARLSDEGMLQELDFSQIPNYKYIDPVYRDQYYDPENKYTVPYAVGMVGIIYNTTMVKDPQKSWGLMWDPAYKGQVLNFNNSRDAFMTAQCYAGIDLNTKDIAQWEEAAKLLKKQKKEVDPGYVMDEVFKMMESGEKAIAPYYAGDFLTMQEENPDLDFFYPEEGTNIFVDAMCVPATVKKDSDEYKMAMMYINFMNEIDVALANAEYHYYGSPHTGVVQDDRYSLKGDPILYPEDKTYIAEKCTYYENMPVKILQKYEKLWEDVKAS